MLIRNYRRDKGGIFILEERWITFMMKSIIYCNLIGGIVFLLGEDILLTFKIKNNYPFGKRGLKHSQSILNRHINSLMNMTTSYKPQRKVHVFVLFSLLLFISMLIVLSHYTNPINTILIALLMGFTPYLYLRIKLYSIRISGSHEGSIVVRELVNQYRINYNNIIEAIERVAKIKTAPVSQKAFYLLSIKIKECKTKEEIIHELETLTFIINTQWMKMLANNIYMAIEFGTNITSGLEDILFELKESKKIEEKKNQLNIESFSILNVLSPVMYAASILISIKYFDFSLRKFFEYQLKTPMGIKFLTLILLLTLLNRGIMLLVGKKKFDI
ncbi:MAG: hypothetical protein WC996_07785 [Peptostreptococcales bacterium]